MRTKCSTSPLALFPHTWYCANKAAVRLKRSRMSPQHPLNKIFNRSLDRKSAGGKGRWKTLESQDSCLQREGCPYRKNYTTGLFQAAKAGAVWSIDTSIKHLRRQVKVGGREFKACDIDTGDLSVWSSTNLSSSYPRIHNGVFLMFASCA